MSTVYLGMKGSVMAIDRKNGSIVWETKLSGSGMVNVVWDDGLLLAHTRGELYAVVPENGRIAWKNDLPGKGYGMGTFASPTLSSGDQQAMVMEIIQAQQRSAAASGGAAGGA